MKNILDKRWGIAAAAVICNLLWGSAYPGIKIGYELFNITDSVFQKMFFAGLRFVLAGIMVLAVSIPVNKRLPKLTRSNAGIIALTGLVYTACQYVFFYIGLSNTTGSNGSIVNSSTTFIALIAGHFVYKESVGIRKLAGAVIGFAGVIVVLVSGGIGGFSFFGEGFILIAAVCFVFGSMISKRANRESDAMTVTGYNLLIGGLILLLTGLAGGGTLDTVNTGGIAVLLYLAFLSAAAFTLWTMLLDRAGVGSISSFNFIIPVSGTILSAIFMHENIFELRYAISLGLVCAGILLVNLSEKVGK
ncbi:MAG: DMT family transporter [Candidatus Ornithomonoglobus sp.]